MPLAQQPKDIDAYEPKDDEVKILRPRYDPASGQVFLGIEYCVGLITVRNDPQEQFFGYGYKKDNAKVLFSTQKLKIPNSFKITIFGQHRMQYEGGAFDGDFSQVYFYLPSTVDRNEKINKYLNSVNLKPFATSSKDFGDDFDPADFGDFNRTAVVNMIKKVALQSSQNLKKNADAFLSIVSHENDKSLWPGRKRTQNDKFTLTY